MALPISFNKHNKNRNNGLNHDDRTLIANTDNKQRAENASKLAQEFLNNCRLGTIEQIGVLNTDVLMTAPKGYFDSVQKVAKKLTEKIQGDLSNSDKSTLIARLKGDPTDTTLRGDAFQAINTEYLKYDSNPDSIAYRSFNKLEKAFVLAMVFNEICGLGPLEPFYRDDRVKEIMCNGPYDVDIEMEGLFRVESCRFSSADHLQELINKLYSSVNREITRTNPRDNARLHDKSRLFATHQAIAPDGPNLNIRKHPEEWISPQMLLEWDSVSEELLQWLGYHINAGCSFIVNGGTGSGKTTTLSALLGFYPNNKRIVTIEKNIELKVPQWKMHAAALECIPRKNDSKVYVDMRDLVECCTQMRPDMIVCGEIIGPEGYDFVQAGNTGHQVASTIHSNSSEKCIERIISLVSQAGLIMSKDTLELISASIDFIVTVTRLQDGSRKITNISEVGTKAVTGANGAYLPVNPIWEYQPNTELSSDGKITGRWVKVGSLSEDRKDMHRLGMYAEASLSELLEPTLAPKKE